MIIYDPIEGSPLSETQKNKMRPKTCFIMSQLGTPIPQETKNIRRTLEKHLKNKNFKTIDANSEIKGKDFLFKIWKMILSVPIGIAIISDDMNPYTLSNIFYEIGLLQSYGKETVIIKTKKAYVPSDFIRTEYIEYDRAFKSKMIKFINGINEQAEYYAETAELLEKNPLLSIDYFRRAFLITNNLEYLKKAQNILDNNTFDKQTNSWLKHFLKF